jgi:phosphoesterase RecJ-like protein
MYFNEAQITEIKDKISNAKNILVVVHEFPDGDAVGSLIACHNILTQFSSSFSVSSFVNSPIPDSYDFIAKDFQIISDEKLNSDNFDIAFVLDCGNIDRTGIRERLEKINIINIDHHGDNTFFGKQNYVFTDASSTSEILFFLAEKIIPFPFKSIIASSLYTGIVTDTGGFKFPCTSSNTHIAASKLYQCDANLEEVINNIYFKEPYNKMKLLGEILSNMKLDDGICYSAINKEMWEKTATNPKMVEGLVNFMASISEAKMAALFQELPDKVKASLRSRGTVDCRKIAHNFNGGGHTQAAGARFPLPLDNAISSFLEYAKENIK